MRNPKITFFAQTFLHTLCNLHIKTHTHTHTAEYKSNLGSKIIHGLKVQTIIFLASLKLRKLMPIELLIGNIG